MSFGRNDDVARLDIPGERYHLRAPPGVHSAI